MTIAEDAQKLWLTATALTRQAGAVSPHGHILPPLLFMSDPQRTPAPWETVAHLPEGSAIVYRAFSAPDALINGHKIKEACLKTGVKMLVGRDDQLARDLNADGLHLPERDLERSGQIRDRHGDWIITCAIHAATNAPALQMLDAIIVSPVFQAGGASAARQPLGLAGFDAIAAASPCPAYALGGISPRNADTLLASKACGLAGIDAIRLAFGQRDRLKT